MTSISDFSAVCYLIVVLCICVRLYVIDREVSEILRLTRNSEFGIGVIKKEISRSAPDGLSSTSSVSESENLSGEASVNPVKVEGQ